MVQSRIKTIAKINKKDKLEKLKSLNFSFKYKPCRSKDILNVKNLSFGYDKTLFKNLNFSIKANDRICIIGKNGKGKTTLLKIIAEKLSPKTGKVIYSPQIKKGFFEQTNVSSLLKSRTIEEEISCSNINASKQHVREICAAMMFNGD